MVNKKSSKGKKSFTKQQLTIIRKALVKEKVALMEEFLALKDDSLKKSLKDASGDLSGYSFHMADMATDMYDREFSLEMAEVERERLYAIDDALKRIDEGSYGVCDMCNELITKQRLKVMPQAKYCIECQEKEEKSAGK